jgi:hypothetical protein
MNRLIIELRHKQIYLNGDPDQPVTVRCNADGTATYIPGLVGSPNWQDFTEDTEGLDDFRLTWKAISEDYTNGDSTGESNSFGSNYDKGVTADLRFFGNAFTFIQNWLMLQPCQVLNAVEARITDLSCGKSYRPFEIKTDNTKYAPFDEPCIVAMPLREADQVWHSFQKTIIEDDWQGWFNSQGTSSKDHPTFSMIVEKKPKFFLAFYVVLIYVVGMLSTGILIALDDGKRWIRRSLGFVYFCPSPLIRTYIQNICSKFGYTFNTIFDDVPANPYRDTCFFWPASATYKNFDSFDSPSTKYIWDNRSVLSFSKFLNQLKKVFNAEWYITPNSELVFQHKKYFENLLPIYDFTAPGADPFYKFLYTFNGTKKPAYGDYQYLIDPQDTCSNEVKWRYNDIVDFDGPANNPMLEGNISKSFDFAMTAFHNDGSSEDFLEEAVRLGRLVALGAITIGLGELFLAANPITVAVVAALLAVGYDVTNSYVNNFFNTPNLNGIVRVSNSEINIPRLVLWDRNSPLNKSVVVGPLAPATNPYYNPTARDYYTEHPTQDSPGYFGSTVTKVYNYPMFIDALYLGNLYDQFHDYDNPLRNHIVNQDFELTVDLCCDWLDRLGAWEGDFAKIGAVLVLEQRGTRKIKGRISNIEANYKEGTILIKGNVMQ